MKRNRLLNIVYQDEYYVAIDKPYGLLVHRTKIAEQQHEFALQLLRDQIGKKVYPVHRLDRPTSGVLIFALSSEAARRLQIAFQQQKTQKIYLALVRGYTPQNGVIDMPLTKSLESKKLVTAITEYENIEKIEIPMAISRYKTARFSIVKVRILTGRMHQIRRHFAKIRHYIIGDNKHGDVKQNKAFRQHFNLQTLLLHALQLEFEHPFTEQHITIKAPLRADFKQVIRDLLAMKS